jgi:hypothetical protein
VGRRRRGVREEEAEKVAQGMRYPLGFVTARQNALAHNEQARASNRPVYSCSSWHSFAIVS